MWHPICKQAARAEKKLKVGSRVRVISERWHVSGDVAPESLLEVNGCGGVQAWGSFPRLARALSPLPRGQRVAVAEAVSGDLPPGWHQPTPQAGRGHSSPLTNPPTPLELLLPLCTQLATGRAACWVWPGHSPDSRSGPERSQSAKLDSRVACNGHGHRQQVDERAEELDLE